MFDFRYEKVGKDQDILAVVVSGSLDESNANYLLDCVQDNILEGRKKVILDCSRLTYVSSMGLGVLARVHSRMKKLGGDVNLAGIHGPVATVMELVKFSRLFHFYPTVQDAIAAHGG
jgi:anti-anti-sigma factor